MLTLLSALSPDQWPVVSAHLEDALAMPEEERSAWLSSLRLRDPLLGRQLEILLEEHRALSQEGFLESPAHFPGARELSGQAIGVYRLRSQIGEGGMGTVWLADRDDGRFERRVALKLLNIALMGRGGELRFRREGRILGRLAHPNIAQLIDAGVSRTGQPYLVLEHVDGDHIDLYCDQHKLDVKGRIQLFLDVLNAVAKAHANLIVHRDLKPSNVLVRDDGQVKLLDFGIAKLLEDQGRPSEDSAPSQESRPMTPGFAAPEQLKGEPVTTATDVFALGVLLYIMLTGEHPAGPGPHAPADLVKAIVDTEVLRASDSVARMNPETAKTNAARRGTTADRLQRVLRGDLDTIVAKAMRKDPGERYGSATALADDLRRYLRDEPISARPETMVYRAVKFARRNFTAVSFAAAAIVATGAGLAGTLVQARTARAQLNFAMQQLSRAESVTDLNDFLLADAGGKAFTVAELLNRAEQIVERQPDLNPASHVELLVSIGRKYESQDQDGKARQMLETAYRISRGLADISVRAHASCALGEALGHSDLPQAEKLVREGLGQLPHGPQFTLDRVSCLLSGSAVARERGDSEAGIARSQAARQLLQGAPLRSQTAELRALMALGESYRTAGRYGEAIPVFEQISLLMEKLGRDDTGTAGTLFNNWGLALHLGGRPLEAEKLFRRAIEISSSDSSGRGVSPMLLTNYARTLRELGRMSAAAEYAERGYIEAVRAGDQVVTNQSLLLRSRIYGDQGKLALSQKMLAEVEPRLRRSLPPSHLAFAVLASQHALLASGRGDLPLATGLTSQALAITEASLKSGQGGADLMAHLLIMRSDMERRMGQAGTGAVDAERAIGILKKTTDPGTFSRYLGQAYNTLGRALQEEGEREKARAAFRTAAKHLQVTLGPDHPETRRVLALAETGRTHQ
jgi:eukaryotic-like serine/threonine-protein kinase